MVDRLDAYLDSRGCGRAIVVSYGKGVGGGLLRIDLYGLAGSDLLAACGPDVAGDGAVRII